MVEQPALAVSADDLTRLADDLDEMQRHLDTQVRRMDAIVDRIESGWRGEAAKGYRALHRGAAEDAVRIREILQVLEEAMRMGRDGFTQQELDVLHAMRSVQSKVDVAAEARELSEGTPPPRSRINDL
ncbi:WXG100 family type VII secretion target [Streptomyces sp. NBC_01433]|uniref:WXG100 family type VII secretion target n=1 Tax=Streptomyces sp. NBC_01433 TaxID=2903864 RepID=UPI0022523D19|nr:WXG100 family type VII secretion target [Streptomyces sp. NBC_01433]MCX4675318.1 WXG100 family type VII secretion target [Streptomyces sp. NBC_01433]